MQYRLDSKFIPALEVYSRVLIPSVTRYRRISTRGVLKRAIQRGELPPGTEIDLVIDAIGGATTFRLLQGHAPLSRKFADALVTLVLSGCRTPHSRAR